MKGCSILAGISLRCLKVLSPFWTTLLRCCDSSPTHNCSGLCSIGAMTMAATSPINSVWTRKSMRRFSSLPAWRHTRFGWLPNQGHGQLVVTLPLLVLSSSYCAAHLSSRCAGWLLHVLPLDALPSCRLGWLPHHHLSSSYHCTSLLSSNRARHDDGTGKQGDRRHDNGNGRHTARGGTTTARGSRATGGMTTVTGSTTTETDGTTTARGSRASGGMTAATWQRAA